MCIAAPRSRPLIDLFKYFFDFQSRPSQLRCRVLRTFSSTISTAKKGKTQVGAEVGDGKRIPNKYGHICSGFFLTPSPTSPQYSNLLLLKMIYNTKKSSDKQTETSTFGLSPVNSLGLQNPRKKEILKRNMKKYNDYVHVEGVHRPGTDDLYIFIYPSCPCPCRACFA